MTMPVAARAAAAVIGGLLVLSAWYSMIGTLIVPRPVSSSLTRWVDRIIDAAFHLASDMASSYKRRDRILSAEAAAILIAQIVAWLGFFYVGYALLLWPFARSASTAFTLASPAVFGANDAVGAAGRILGDLATVSGLITITLQIAYLPTLYSAFNRRETEVALLNARAGVPSWGPELLARTHYALGSGISTIDTLPGLYADWERWASDVAESHTTYLPLVRFRSPKPLSSWVTGLLAVLDSAALILSLSPTAAPEVPARLCLRSGFTCLREVARAMGLAITDEPGPETGISLRYEEFLDAVERMRKVDFPIERDPADAWPDFMGWRVNYEQPAYAIAMAVDAVPALWSGPRRHAIAPIPPVRPGKGRVPEGKRAAGAAPGRGRLTRQHRAGR
jgi:hypothetical protein